MQAALCLIYHQNRKHVASDLLYLWVTEDQLHHWLVCYCYRSCLMSVIEQEFLHEFAFDKKIFKTLDELEICWKRLKLEHHLIQSWTLQHSCCWLIQSLTVGLGMSVDICVYMTCRSLFKTRTAPRWVASQKWLISCVTRCWLPIAHLRQLTSWRHQSWPATCLLATSLLTQWARPDLKSSLPYV